jgi:octaprenyl-diphosphate synthase
MIKTNMENNSYQLLLENITAETGRIDACMRADLSRLTPAIDSLLMEVLEYGLFTGGKRIRPLLVVTAARLCGNTSGDSYRLGIAFEYLHGATLFHDDIIDRSKMRRGQATVCQKFGTVPAILAGDFLHAHSMSLVGKLAGQAGLKSFCRATKAMVDGEFMQLRNARKHNLSELDYHDAIMGKTGLFISSACEIGGIYGGGDPRQLLALKNYGEYLGCAFQIIDDLLDYQGDPRKTGKGVGNDLDEGKMTLPLILAVARASGADRSRLLEIVSQNELRGNCFQEMYDLVDHYQGFSGAKERADKAVAEAIKELAVFSIPQASRDRELLEGLARFVLSRQK